MMVWGQWSSLHQIAMSRQVSLYFSWLHSFFYLSFADRKSKDSLSVLPPLHSLFYFYTKNSKITVVMFLRRRRQMRADVVLSVSLINVKDYARQESLCSSQTEHDSSSLFLIEEKYIPHRILFHSSYKNQQPQ